MRQFLFTLFLISSFPAVQSQTLNFSQVVNYQGAFNNGNTTCGPDLSATCKSSPVYTVPSGKVWKIESTNCIGNVANNSGWPAYWMSLKINGVDIIGGANGNGFYINGEFRFPIWLKEGTTLQCLLLGGTVTTNYFLSIIEFSVTP